MLSGKRPLRAAPFPRCSWAMIREEPEPLEALVPKTPAPVRWLVERLLAKDPDGRYDSTRDLLRDLRKLNHHASGAGLASSAAGLATAGTRGWKSRPSAMAGAFVIAAGCLGAPRWGAW